MSGALESVTSDGAVFHTAIISVNIFAGALASSASAHTFSGALFSVPSDGASILRAIGSGTVAVTSTVSEIVARSFSGAGGFLIGAASEGAGVSAAIRSRVSGYIARAGTTAARSLTAANLGGSYTTSGDSRSTSTDSAILIGPSGGTGASSGSGVTCSVSRALHTITSDRAVNELTSSSVESIITVASCGAVREATASGAD